MLINTSKIYFIYILNSENKADIDYKDNAHRKFPRFDFHLELCMSLKRNDVPYFWTKIFECP